MRRRLEPELIDVAPAPVFAGLEAAHDGVLGLMEVLGCMRVGRIVAAADVAAFETEAQMHPFVSGRETFFAPLGCLRCYVVHVRKVLALLSHTAVP